ncbi:MAG: hypothetical protein H0V67_11170 [Geodermatophilaceae bacterium]|nr:hypothetical protein [Geodermatophilaceae bacterium]
MDAAAHYVVVDTDNEPKRITKANGGGGGGSTAPMFRVKGLAGVAPWWAAPGRNTLGSSSANKTFWWPFFLPEDATITEMVNYVNTAEAGSLLRFGVYNAGLATNPGTRYTDAGTVSGAATGMQTLATSIALTAGNWWLCAAASDHATVRWSRFALTGYPPLGQGVSSNRSNWGRILSSVDNSAALPATDTSTATADNVEMGSLPSAWLTFAA